MFGYAAAMLLLDGLALAAALTAGRWLGSGPDMLLLGATVLGFQAVSGLYQQSLPFQREAEQMLRAATAAAITTAGALWALGRLGHAGLAVAVAWLLLLVLLPLVRLGGKRVLARWNLLQRRTLLVGARRHCELILQAIAREPHVGYAVLGCLTPDPADYGAVVGQQRGEAVRVVGTAEESAAIIGPFGVAEVILAGGDMEARAQSALIRRLQQQVDAVHLVVCEEIPADYADLTCLLYGHQRVWRPGGAYNRGGMVAKRLLDLTGGLLLLLPLGVLMGLIALRIRLDSPGPILYRDRRLGQGGRVFACLKFRTMHVDGDAILQAHLAVNPEARLEWETYRKLQNDPRITRVGAFLRRWSLDELPQLFNVLWGDMSLVGNRPYRVEESHLLGPYTEELLALKPGIAGLWAVMGRSKIPFEQRVLLETWYSRNWWLWTDLVLLLRTVGVVLSRRGAY